MTIDEILKWTGGGLALLLTAVQITPVKINPWSWIFEKIGKAFSRAVLEKLGQQEKDLAGVKKKVESIEERIDKGEADQCRQRILRFNDELLHNMEHSKEYFDNVLDDIDTYERYCKTHENYLNSKAEMAIANVKAVYKKLSAKGGFL